MREGTVRKPRRESKPRQPRSAAAISYYEKLKDPRWQKKRLRVLDLADWKCEGCGANDKTLTVHHGYYRKGAEPWDYPDNTLWSLCEDCHVLAEENRHDAYLELARVHPLLLGPPLIRHGEDVLGFVRRAS